MPSDDLLRYHMKQTDIRFDRLEKKVDKLISFRMMLIGAAVGASGLVSVIFQVTMEYLRK